MVVVMKSFNTPHLKGLALQKMYQSIRVLMKMLKETGWKD